ncbi:MAG: CARDB domain-containing protein [Dehalococcoidales bacterium]
MGGRAGEYVVSIDDLQGTYQVKAPKTPAAFTTSALSVSSSDVKPGDNVTISATVTNTGETQGSYEVRLKINDEVIETKEALLAGGASENITFTTARDESGSYVIDIGGLTSLLVVKEDTPPSEQIPLPLEPSESTSDMEPIPTSKTNWGLISGIITGLIVLAGVTFYLVVLRRRVAPKSSK